MCIFSAADAETMAAKESNWNSWATNSNPLLGAVVLFHDCNAPTNPYGHACLGQGNGNCYSDEVGSQTFAWYNAHYCNANPSGWIMPDSCGSLSPTLVE